MTAEPQPTVTPETAPPTGAASGRRAPRTPAERDADHAAIERLADDLLPALAAKLGASGLGEIEVGEDDWTVRVRRPGDGSSGQGRRATDKPSRAQPGHAGHGHAPGGFEGHRSARDAKAGPAHGTSSGTSPTGGTADPASQNGHMHDGSGDGHRTDGHRESHRVIATSPAVGVFHPRTEIKPGARVRNGDRLGAVDMLGVPQEVIAPADGLLGASLVEPGDAVEYGQELLVIELVSRSADRADG